jgi:adenylate kinase
MMETVGPMRLVLLGAPGSGKGTQGEALADRFGVEHVSSGELVRRHIAEGTDIGREAASYADRGELVPDDLVLRIVGEAVTRAAAAGGYVLDGFPRSLAQAQRAYEIASQSDLTADAVVYLAVPDDIARERLGHRDVGRADDNDPAVIDRRLQVFHAETEPLLDFYRTRGILHEIDATPPPDEVTRAMLAALTPPD